jgi:hypothetical protein
MAKLDPSFRKNNNTSGICHHMIFETKYINEIFQIVESNHNKPFWIVFLEQVDNNQISYSGASEYELYYNYIISNHFDNIRIRPLQWANTSITNPNLNYDYISDHHYIRK